VAASAAEAAKLATAMGFPVVLKIVSPEILHKTEAGGVLVGVKSADDVAKGYDTIIANAKKYNAKANLLGVQVQQMLTGGQEVIIGAVTDQSFGKLVAFGLGGILVEVLKDITFRLAPATRDDALSMLDGVQAAEILKGVRGADPVDREALANVIVGVSQLISEFPEIAEMDLNPVFATKNAAIAADVRIVVDWNPAPARYRPSHDDIVRDMNRIMKPDAVAVIGASSERRQDRQLGDEEFDQRRLQGRDLSDQPVRRRDHGPQGVQERQGCAGQDRRRGIRDSGEIRRASPDRSRREKIPAPR
jgi:acyl-CoA synthetase (NDP forming)